MEYYRDSRVILEEMLMAGTKYSSRNVHGRNIGDSGGMSMVDSGNGSEELFGMLFRHSKECLW